MGRFCAAIFNSGNDRLAKLTLAQTTSKPSSLAFVQLHGWITWLQSGESRLSIDEMEMISFLLFSVNSYEPFRAMIFRLKAITNTERSDESEENYCRQCDAFHGWERAEREFCSMNSPILAIELSEKDFRVLAVHIWLTQFIIEFRKWSFSFCHIVIADWILWPLKMVFESLIHFKTKSTSVQFDHFVVDIQHTHRGECACALIHVRRRQQEITFHWRMCLCVK